MKLYAVYDPDADLYLTRGLTPRLDELGIDTRFFKTRSEAMRHIEDRRWGLETTNLQNDLAFWLLEKVYDQDRWHLNVGREEFMDACDQFKKLRVQAVVIGRADE